MYKEPSFATGTTVEIGWPSEEPRSILRAVLVFPRVARKSSAGVSGGGARAQRPNVPDAAAFRGEALDWVLFSEGYISASDHRRAESR